MIESMQTQYAAVRDGGAGLIDLSARGRILVSGADAQMFLNGLITNDMKTLAPNTWMPAAFINVQGRLIAASRVLHRDDGYLIDTEAETREAVLKLLDRFTLAGDFRVTDVTDETTQLSVQGRAAANCIRETFGARASEIERRAVLRRSDSETWIIRATHTAEDGYDIFVDREESEGIRRKLTTVGVVPIDSDTQETLRIEAGIPCFGIDMDDTTLLPETNLEDEISYSKGCYVGQEIVVRIKHRGHVAKKLTGIVFVSEHQVTKDAKIFSLDDQEIGRVTSSTFSPRLNKSIALAYVKYDYLKPETQVRVLSNQSEHAGEVRELPFVSGSWLSTPEE